MSDPEPLIPWVIGAFVLLILVAIGATIHAVIQQPAKSLGIAGVIVFGLVGPYVIGKGVLKVLAE